jgi:hypothetical protein
MPISLAASSHTQIGSAPFSNFRHRLSQSIIGTKQLKVEETDSGSPFFIHTRNRAGCSPSLVQEVGLRILPAHWGCAGRESPTRHPWSSATRFAKRRSAKNKCGVRGQPRDDLDDEAQFEAQTSRQDCTVLRGAISAMRTLQLPLLRKFMHKLSETRAFLTKR